MGAMRYRRRGSDVEAFCWTGDERQSDEDPAWARDLITLGRMRFRDAGTDAVVLLIDPPSGQGAPLVATRGDWIVRKGTGEVFPMTPERFAATYDVVWPLNAPGRWVTEEESVRA